MSETDHYEDFPKLLSEISYIDNGYYVENEFLLQSDDDCDSVCSEFDYDSLFAYPTKQSSSSSQSTNSTDDATDSSISSNSISSDEGVVKNIRIRSKKQQKMRRRVSFSSVEIREYSITVGDHPHCKGGLPMSLDWGYTGKKTSHCVNAYEKTKVRNLHQPSELKPKKLDYVQRKQRLSHVTGYTEERLLDIAKLKELNIKLAK
mmetsp:Transcript_12673/g.19489  ORF Transcript_12673/g.19489 Transcript_12673/m.19489 type:complete len:204 (-) Transcript_12673:62-673(-)|eukprot:CAMPEP_0178898814 /NCGR_PEP_ID=MMETSP0786-20121207/2552_1 /TAXON_ID=186022 /ORGANISM="Thalassionema frauenfeldii, Strain CCMP 1798" /LENGTH=203 /DNA_ID=CAMNT_0020569599 /DNA_START=41 /DNA_END=652 /DNA_ORIENTATION=-